MTDLSLNSDAIENAYDFVGDDSTKTPYTERLAAEGEDDVVEIDVQEEPEGEAGTPTDAADALEAIRQDPFAIRKVAKRAQTDDEVLLAIVDDGSGKERPKLDDKGIAKARSNAYVYERLLEKNPWRLDEVPEKKVNRALVRTAIEHSEGHPEVLAEVPERFRNKPTCKLAVEVEPASLQYVPDDFKTRKMCKSAVERDFHCIQWVPKGLIDAKTRKAAEKQLKLEQLKAEEEERLAREAEEQARAEAEAAKQELATSEDLEGVVLAEDAAALAVAEKEAAELAHTEAKAAPVPAGDNVIVTVSAKAPKRRNPLALHFKLAHQH